MTQKHWTEENDKALLFAITQDFMCELETVMERRGVGRKQLAKHVDTTQDKIAAALDRSRVTLTRMVRMAQALNQKLAVVPYERKGAPVYAGIFRECWELLGRPTDMFAMEEIREKLKVNK